tara:strand:+ start:886 stop:2274 length:1389 start_codon:yes stop_codon:yes gene_type:complete
MSEIKVNKISPRANCGTVQLGDSGDTITIPAGATITNNGTQTGFGRSGSVNWQTTPKTGNFTAADGEGYFINSSSPITMSLPAGSAGAIVAVSDYARNFNTHNFTISPNGSEKIGGVAEDAVLSVNGQAATFVYVDSTKGWVNVQNAEDTETGLVNDYITATGGSITTVCTNFKVHTFTGPGTFCISAGAGPLAKVDYLVIAGGGGGSRGGGGAGGYRESKTAAVSGCWSASPLVAACASLGPFSPGPISVSVGGGAAAVCTGSPYPAGNSGTPSTFSTITSAGGGGGGGYHGSSAQPYTVGQAGGSGGGGGAYNSPTNTEAGGAGNTPSVSPAQGKNGGNGSYQVSTHTAGGGGGGAAAVGSASPAGGAPAPSATGGAGGAGATSSITSSPVQRAGGAGGSSNVSSGGAGGAGGGGTGGGPGSTMTNGTDNTGGGGGGYHTSGTGGAGGSGLVIIRYRFQA